MRLKYSWFRLRVVSISVELVEYCDKKILSKYKYDIW